MISNPPSPPPKKYHSPCHHKDAEILLDDVRQQRRRRWWIATAAITVVAGSLMVLAAWIYGVGESVGTAQTQMEYMQRAATADRVIIDRNAESVRTMERDNSARYNEIRESLIRIESRLENIERGTKARR